MLFILTLQMGMMKDHVRGPKICCETIAKDILLIARTEALLYHPGFTAANLKAGRVRGQAENFGGESHTRILGAPIVRTSVHVLRAMLKEVLRRPGRVRRWVGAGRLRAGRSCY